MPGIIQSLTTTRNGLCVELFPRFRARGGGHHFVAVVDERELEDLCRHGIIFGDENLHFGRGVRSRSSARRT